MKRIMTDADEAEARGETELTAESTHDSLRAQAQEWVFAQDETGEIDSDQLEQAFAALYGRPADDEDRQAGLWSLCCAACENCGTRPE